MRTILVVVGLWVSLASAQAETWQMRLGGCGDWLARFDVEQDQAGAWVGRVEQVHKGGPCAAPNGAVIQADVRAAIVGEDFFAVRTNGTDKITCSFHGRIEGDRVQGNELCSSYVGSSPFVMRLPPSDDLSLRRPESNRETDLSRDYDSYRERRNERGFDMDNRYRRRP